MSSVKYKTQVIIRSDPDKTVEAVDEFLDEILEEGLISFAAIKINIIFNESSYEYIAFITYPSFNIKKE